NRGSPKREAHARDSKGGETPAGLDRKAGGRGGRRSSGAEIVPFDGPTGAYSVALTRRRPEVQVSIAARAGSPRRTWSRSAQADLQGRGRRFDPSSAYHFIDMCINNSHRIHKTAG